MSLTLKQRGKSMLHSGSYLSYNEGVIGLTEHAERIHGIARNSVATLTKNDSTKLLITQAVDSLNAVYDTLQILRNEMYRLASLLPEFEIVMAMQGAGMITGPQLMAEIGDVRRFTNKGALVAFAGVDAPPFQPGTVSSQVKCTLFRQQMHTFSRPVFSL